jgi:hypothetical protein
MGGQYRVEARATREGIASIDVKVLEGVRAIPVAFFNDLPIGEATALQFAIDVAGQVSTLAVDADGDGAIDENRPPARIASVVLRKQAFQAGVSGTASANVTVSGLRLRGKVRVGWEDSGISYQLSVSTRQLEAIDLVSPNQVRIRARGTLKKDVVGAARSVERNVPILVVLVYGSSENALSASASLAGGVAVETAGTLPLGSVVVSVVP